MKAKLNLKKITALFLIFLNLSSFPVNCGDWVSEAIENATKHQLIPASLTNNLEGDINREEFCELIIALYEKIGEKDSSDDGENPVDDDDSTVFDDQDDEDEQMIDLTNEEEDLTIEEIEMAEAQKRKNEELGNPDVGDDIGVEFDGIEETDEAMEGNFTDTQNEAVLKAHALGIVNGISATEFAPKQLITRQEICTMVVRFISVAFPAADINIHKDTVFYDNYQIDHWAKNAVNYLYSKKIISGISENTIAPILNTTKAEAITIINRIYESKDKFAVKTEINEQWAWAIAPVYDGLGPDTKFSNGLAAVSKGGKYGYIDATGKTAIDFQFDMAYNFSEGLVKVVKNKKVGYIDKTGNVVIPLEYDDGGDFREGFVWLKKGNKYGYAAKDGAIIVPIEYDYAYDCGEGLLPVKKADQYGYLDTSGNQVIDFKFDWASDFSEGLARVLINRNYSYIDKSGNVALDLKYDYLFNFQNGLAVVFNRDQYGVIDKTGKVIVPFNVWGVIFGAANGFIKVTVNSGYEGSYSYLDYSGKTVITKLPLYDADDFSEGLAVVASHAKSRDEVTRSYMDKNGKFILPKRERLTDVSIYDKETFYIQQFSEGMAAAVNQYGKLGFIRNPLLEEWE